MPSPTGAEDKTVDSHAIFESKFLASRTRRLDAPRMTTLQTKGVAIREVDGLSTEAFDSSSQKALARPEFAMARKFTIRIVFFAVLASLLGFCLPQKHSATTNTVTFPDLYEASIAELQSGLASGLFTSVDLVKV